MIYGGTETWVQAVYFPLVNSVTEVQAKEKQSTHKKLNVFQIQEGLGKLQEGGRTGTAKTESKVW